MSRQRLGELLVQEGKIDEDQLKSALGYQRRWGTKLGVSIVRLGFMNELALCEVLSRVLKLPLIDLTRLDLPDISDEVLNTIDIKFARKNRIVPVSISESKGKRRLFVATSEPMKIKTLEEIQFKSGFPVVEMIVPDSDIDWFIQKFYEKKTTSENYVSCIHLIRMGADNPKLRHSMSSLFEDSQFMDFKTSKKGQSSKK